MDPHDAYRVAWYSFHEYIRNKLPNYDQIKSKYGSDFHANSDKPLWFKMAMMDQLSKQHPHLFEKLKADKFAPTREDKRELRDKHREFHRQTKSRNKKLRRLMRKKLKA